MDSKAYWLETVGDISSYPAHAGQLSLDVQAFQENRLTYPVRVRRPSDTTSGPVGHFRVYRDPREGSGASTNADDTKPVTSLEIRLPGDLSKDRLLGKSLWRVCITYKRTYPNSSA